MGRRVLVLAVGPDLRRDQRDPAQHHRRPRPATAEGGLTMRFAFTDDQLLFADGLRDLLTKEFAAADLRTLWEDGRAHSPALWQQLADMGVIGVLAPEDAGGMGLGMVDAIL